MNRRKKFEFYIWIYLNIRLKLYNPCEAISQLMSFSRLLQHKTIIYSHIISFTSHKQNSLDCSSSYDTSGNSCTAVQFMHVVLHMAVTRFTHINELQHIHCNSCHHQQSHDSRMEFIPTSQMEVVSIHNRWMAFLSIFVVSRWHKRQLQKYRRIRKYLPFQLNWNLNQLMFEDCIVAWRLQRRIVTCTCKWNEKTNFTY